MCKLYSLCFLLPLIYTALLGTKFVRTTGFACPRAADCDPSLVPLGADVETMPFCTTNFLALEGSDARGLSTWKAAPGVTGGDVAEDMGSREHLMSPFAWAT